MNVSPWPPIARRLLAVALFSTAFGGQPAIVAAQDSPAAAPEKETAPTASNANLPTAPAFAIEVAPLLGQFCVSCHSGPEPTGDLVLKFADDADLRQRIARDRDFLDKIAGELTNRLMPPETAERQPNELERKLLIRWAQAELHAANSVPDPGPYQLRRLNNREYANTIRDLLYLPADYNAAADFPADERGDGFDNNSDTLILSPLLVEQWLAAAEKSVNKALNLEQPDVRRDATLPSKTKLNEPILGKKVDFASRKDHVRTNLAVFAPRAFRRPVSEQELDGLMKFTHLAFTHDGESFDRATSLTIRAALMSPDFLFRVERDPNPNGTAKVFQVTEFQLATRMSYFLWSSMPDEELYNSAKDGGLRANLAAQLARMLQDPKASSLTKDFLGQWLEIRSLAETPNCPPALLAAMKGETEHFFNYIIREDRSIMEFLEADYTFVNEELARHYGIEGVEGEEFQQVAVDPAQRGGIFTQASFLTLTAKPLGTSRRTSPVNRGKWILENIFSQKIPPPPPDVPSLAIDNGAELKGTVRQIFEQHRADPKCAGCHARMDAYGFALENYDGFGAWRTQDNHVEVDASGDINGQVFTTPREFRTILASRRGDFRRSLVQKMLSYALGRTIQGYDRPAVDAICAAVEADGDRFSSLIQHIIESYPFQHARGNGASKSSDMPSLGALMDED